MNNLSYVRTHEVLDSYILPEKLLQDLLQAAEKKKKNKNFKIINSKVMVWKNW